MDFPKPEAPRNRIVAFLDETVRSSAPRMLADVAPPLLPLLRRIHIFTTSSPSSAGRIATWTAGYLVATKYNVLRIGRLTAEADR